MRGAGTLERWIESKIIVIIIVIVIVIIIVIVRMDGAWLGSVDIAIKKAKTSLEDLSLISSTPTTG